MADVLDLQDNADYEIEDVDGDRTVLELKSSVTKRKGRGFGDSTKDKNDKFDTLEDVKVEGVGPQRSIEGWIVFVTNVHEESQKDDIADVFAEIGPIKNIHLNLDRRTGFIKGYALIEFETFTDAQKAIEELNGRDILGSNICVDWAFVRGNNKPKKNRRSDYNRHR